MTRSSPALALLVLLCAPAGAVKIERIPVRSPLAGGAASIEVAAEQLMVKFSTVTPPPGGKAAALAAAGATVLQELEYVGWTLVELPAGMSVASALTGLRGLPGVEAVEPNHVYRPSRLPNDPQVPSQYGLSQINAFGAWELERGQSNLNTIAVIDSGVLATHPEFAGKLTAAESQFFNPNAGGAQSANSAVACNHGTRVAGIAAAGADNATGMAGVSWGARIVSLRVFDIGDCNPAGDCPGTCTTTDAALINAVTYAAGLHGGGAYGRVVVNMSIGGSGACPAAMLTALNNAGVAGVPVVISAGNDGGEVNTPAICAAGTNAVIPVGATDSGNNISGFSSRGTALANYGVVAPGQSVFTTDLNNSYIGGATGTSFSAPHAAGVAALIASASPAICGSLACAQDIRTKIRAGADGIGVSAASAGLGPLGNSSGAGRVNAFKSVRLQVRGTLSDFDGQEKVVAFPNPFRVSETGTMSFAIPPSLAGTGAKIKIYSVAGELVKELRGLAWDGKNENGDKVASGTYLFHVKTSAGKSTGRFAVIR